LSAEVWQFVVAAVAGVVVILLWLIFIYLPRWTGENGSSRSRKEGRKDHKKNDRRN